MDDAAPASPARRQKSERPVSARTKLITQPLSDDPETRAKQLSLAPSSATLRTTFRGERDVSRDAIADRRGISKHTVRIAPPGGGGGEECAVRPSPPPPRTRPRAKTLDSPRRVIVRSRSGDLPETPRVGGEPVVDRDSEVVERALRRMDSMVTSYNDLKDNVEKVRSAPNLKSCLKRSQSVETGLYQILHRHPSEDDTVGKPAMKRSPSQGGLKSKPEWGRPSDGSESPRLTLRERAQQFSNRIKLHGAMSLPRDMVLSPGSRDVIRDRAARDAARDTGKFDRSLPHFCVCVIKTYTEEEMLEREEARIAALRACVDARKLRRRLRRSAAADEARTGTGGGGDDAEVVVAEHKDGTVDTIRESVPDEDDMDVSVSESDTEDMLEIEKLRVPTARHERKRETWFVVASPDRLEFKRAEAMAQYASYQRKIDADIRYYGSNSKYKGCFADFLDMTDTSHNDDPHLSHALRYMAEIEEESDKAHRDLETMKVDRAAAARYKAEEESRREEEEARLRAEAARAASFLKPTRSSMRRYKSTMNVLCADGFGDLDEDSKPGGVPVRTTPRKTKSVKWNSKADVRHFGGGGGSNTQESLPLETHDMKCARKDIDPASKLIQVAGVVKHRARFVGNIPRSRSMPGLSQMLKEN